MKKSWLEGLDPELQKEIRGDFISSLLVRNRLKLLLENKIKEVDNASTTKIGYDNPNWAYYQADIVGFKRAIKHVIDLITE